MCCRPWPPSIITRRSPQDPAWSFCSSMMIPTPLWPILRPPFVIRSGTRSSSVSSCPQQTILWNPFPPAKTFTTNPQLSGNRLYSSMMSPFLSAMRNPLIFHFPETDECLVLRQRQDGALSRFYDRVGEESEQDNS